MEAIQQLIRSGNLTGLDLSGCWTPEASQPPEGSALHRADGTGEPVVAVNGVTLSGSVSLAGSSSTGTAASSSGDGVIKAREEAASPDAKASEVTYLIQFSRK